MKPSDSLRRLLALAASPDAPERKELERVLAEMDRAWVSRQDLRRRVTAQVLEAYRTHPTSTMFGSPSPTMVRESLVSLEERAFDKETQRTSARHARFARVLLGLRKVAPVLRRITGSKGGRPAKFDADQVRALIRKFERDIIDLRKVITAEARKDQETPPRVAIRNAAGRHAALVVRMMRDAGWKPDSETMMLMTFKRLLTSRMSPRTAARRLVAATLGLSFDRIRKLDGKLGESLRKF